MSGEARRWQRLPDEQRRASGLDRFGHQGAVRSGRATAADVVTELERPHTMRAGSPAAG